MAFITMIIMPVYHWYLPPFMILWGVLWIFEIRTRTGDIQRVTIYNKLLFILFILFFAWQIAGMLYSDNPREGWRNIELHLSLLVFPLVLISPGDMIRQKITTLLRVFALSTFFYLIVCYGYALYRSLNVQDGILTFNPHLPVETWLNYFYASELAIFQHPSYLSMYILLSAYIAFESFFDGLASKNVRVFWLVVAIILLVSIYFLSSRAAILTTVITVPFYVFRKSKIIGENKYLGISVLIGILILLPILLTNPRVNIYLKWSSGKELSDMTLKEGRITIWNTVNNIMKQNIIFGVGTGDIQNELNKEYIKTGNSKLAKGNYNAHNQYIEVMLENGLIGLTIFLSLLGMMVFIAIKERNLIYIMFFLIILFSFLFETMLNRLGGNTFFALFSFLLIHVDQNKKIVPVQHIFQVK
ncbi:MAG: O-antigen ligase family protein [Bacteroidota bacterium]